VKSIDRPEGDRPRLDSADLESIARLMSGRTRIQCGKCQTWVRLTVEKRELRIGSTPDMSQIDPAQPSRPRLVFWCPMCFRQMGFIEGSEWASTEDEAAAAAGPTRWNHLELNEHDPDHR